MTKLDHTSTKALMADMNRNKDSMFTCAPDGSSPSDPWWLAEPWRLISVSVTTGIFVYDINIFVKCLDGVTREEDCVLSRGVLRFHHVSGSWILMVAGDAKGCSRDSEDLDTLLRRRLNNNLRGIFA